MPLNEVECGAFPPCAAYHAPLSVVWLSRRDKPLTASSLEAKLTLRTLRVFNTPRAHLSELRWQKCPISTSTTVRELRVLVYLITVPQGLWWLPFGQCSTSVPLHSTSFDSMIPGKVHRTRGKKMEEGRREGFSRAEQGMFQEGIRSALYALLLKEWRELLNDL